MTWRFDFLPRCDCLEFCFWPCSTAWTVPIIAGQAAIDVIIPRTIVKYFVSGRVTESALSAT